MLKVSLQFLEACHTVTGDVQIPILDFLSDSLEWPNFNMVDFFDLGNEVSDISFVIPQINVAEELVFICFVFDCVEFVKLDIGGTHKLFFGDS